MKIKVKKNPTKKTPLKTCPSEHEEQAALIKWCNANVKQYPELALIFAIPNGGARHIAVARKLKAEGVKSGVPDLFLPAPRKEWAGLFIEMKNLKGRLSPSQEAWLNALISAGYLTLVAWSAKDARSKILWYLGKTT